MERLPEPPSEVRRVQQRSLWLHRAVVDHLVADQERVIAIARANLARWRAKYDGRPSVVKSFDEWESILGRGVDAIVAVCLGTDEHSIDLRQNTPFAGVLSDQERAEIRAAFAASWSADVRSAARENEDQAARAARRREAIDRGREGLRGVYPPGYLEELRDDWPE